MSILTQLAQKIEIEMSGGTRYFKVSAKQGDKGVRYVAALLLDNGTPYEIPDGAAVKANFRKPDGKHCYNDCTVDEESGRVLILLTKQALACAGIVYCDVEVHDRELTEVISSATFTVEVEPAVKNEFNITSSNEYTALEAAIANANNIVHVFSQKIAELNAIVAAVGDEYSNAEVVDARVGADGTEYATVGEHVREIEQALLALNMSMTAYVDSSIIKKVEYDITTYLLHFYDQNGDDLFDPCEIIAGSGSGSGGIGGGSGSSVKVKNMNGTTAIPVAHGEPCVLRFTFRSVDEDGEETGNGKAEIRVNSVLKDTVTAYQAGDEDNPLINEYDVGKFLNNGTNVVQVRVTDVNGVYRALQYTVTAISLSVTVVLDESELYNGDVIVKITPTGDVEKIIYVEVDGEIYSADTITSSGRQTTKTITALPHGEHVIKVHSEANVSGNAIKSNTEVRSIRCVETGNTTPIISTNYATDTLQEGQLVDIPFYIYDHANIKADTDLIILDEEGEEYARTMLTADRTLQHWQTKKYPSGMTTFRIQYGEVIRDVVINVKPLDIDCEAVTDGLECYLDAAGRNNSESDPAVWEYGSATTEFTGFNWRTNGWIVDGNGDTALKADGDARAVIKYRPFSNDWRASGKTLEFLLMTEDINDASAPVISCMFGGIGFEIKADEVTLASEQTSVKCNFMEKKPVRVSFVVESTAANRFFNLYLNGVLTRQKVYPATDNFQQGTPAYITIGSNYAAVNLYLFRAYGDSLNRYGIRDNRIADTKDPALKQQLYEENSIYNAYNEILYSEVVKRIPCITIVGEKPTAKGDKKNVRVIYENQDHPELNFDDEYSIDVQGTSSQFAKRKNWKIKGKTARQHAPGMIASKVFCLKADYYEGTGTHNTQQANIIETLYEGDESGFRTTIYGFPIVVFWQDTESSDKVFNGKYNFNYDKGSLEAYGWTDADECWEFLNNTSDHCLCKSADMTNALDDFEARNPEENTDTTQLGEALAFVASTNTDAATGEVLAEAYTGKDGAIYTKDTEEYRLAKFEKEFEDYFDMEYSLVYYVRTLLSLMVDQRAKNMMWLKEGE